MPSARITARRATLVVLALGLAAIGGGCGGADRRAAHATPAKADRGTAEREARGLIQEAYGSLRRGSAEGLMPLLAADLFAVGPRAADVHVERGGAVVALRDALIGKRHTVKSRALRVAASPGGRAAWATDQIDVDGTSFALVCVLASVDGFWVFTMIHAARVVPDGQLAARIAGGDQPRWGSLPGGRDEGSGAFVSLFESGLAGPGPWLEQLGDSKDVRIIGTAPRAVLKGARAIRRRWKKKGAAAPPALDRRGDLRAVLSADRTLGWLCADVDARGTAADAPTVPQRVIYIYEKTAKRWQLVAVQQSVAAP